MKKLMYSFILLLFLNCADSTELSREYEGLMIIDVHNHDAYKYELSFGVWEKDKITKIVLFGAISEPRAAETDRLAWSAYSNYPDKFYPFFAGFTAYNTDSDYKLDDYAPLIAEYAHRFLISSDSGYGVGYDKAYRVKLWN